MQVCRHMQALLLVPVVLNVPKEESWKGVPSKFMLLNFALFAFNFALLFTLVATKICSIKIFGAKIYIIAEIAEIDSLPSEG